MRKRNSKTIPQTRLQSKLSNNWIPNNYVSVLIFFLFTSIVIRILYNTTVEFECSHPINDDEFYGKGYTIRILQKQQREQDLKIAINNLHDQVKVLHDQELNEVNDVEIDESEVEEEAVAKVSDIETPSVDLGEIGDRNDERSIEEEEVEFSSGRTFEHIPDIQLPNYKKPYEEGEHGYCKHWRAGNRSAVMLNELPAQVNPEEIYMYWHGADELDKRLNGQSRFFCDAAERIGWTTPFKTTNWRPGPTSIAHGKREGVSMLCGGDLWGGWRKYGVLDIVRSNKLTHIQRKSGSPIRVLSKIAHFRLVRDASKKLGCDYVDQGFFSESYDFTNLDDCRRFFTLAKDPSSKIKEGLWLTKSNVHMGAGIKFLNFDEISREYGSCSHRRSFIVQKMVDDMLLMDGRKWDARVYVLVASVNPLIVYSFDIFHVRASMKKFTFDPHQTVTSENKDVFLTNFAVQKDALDSDTSYADHALSPQKLMELAGKSGVEDPHLFQDKIFRKMTAVIEFFCHTVGEWPKINGSYRLYAFDFIVNKDLRPTLIDINYSPGMLYRPGFGKELTESIFDEAVSIVHEVQAGKGLGVNRQPKTKHFHLTYYQDAHAKSYWD